MTRLICHPKLAYFGKVVFLGAAEQASETAIDDLFGHAESVVFHPDEDLAGVGVEVDSDLHFGRLRV